MTVQEQINAGFIKIDQYDWPEDFTHENGQYECWCCDCGVKFLGHKRRVVCKVCSTHSKGIQQHVQGDNGYICNRPAQCAKGMSGKCFSGLDCPDKAVAP